VEGEARGREEEGTEVEAESQRGAESDGCRRRYWLYSQSTLLPR
jgi:hypothetical protein